MEYPEITIKGAPPSKSNQYKIITTHNHGSLCKSKALKDYENAFYMQVGEYRNLDIKGFFELHIRVFYASIRPDLDNSLKVVLDCLQHTKTIENDNKCVKIVAEKFVDKDNPRISFHLVTID
jgi:Holliday junction resolvase RusA-like endonuclease